MYRYKEKKINKEKKSIMASLDYDIDNFSGVWSRSPRYDIYIGDCIHYHDVPEEAVARLCEIAMRKAEIWGEKVVAKEI